MAALPLEFQKSWNDFEIPENPPWNRSEEKSTRKMIEDIKEFRESCGGCIHDSKSEELWLACVKGESSPADEGVAKRLANILKAVEVLVCNRRDMNEMTDNVNLSTFRLWTSDLLCDINKALVDHRNAGQLRTSIVRTTRPNDDIHYYPDAIILDDHLSDTLDGHNKHFNHYLYNMKHSCNVSEEEKITYLIKCAAWLFCRVISLHPFSNGNGRLCRLLVNDVLMEITPFPIQMYNIGNINKDTYFNAIIQYQGSPMPKPSAPNTSNDPSDIAALIVEGLWHGWRAYQKQT